MLAADPEILVLDEATANIDTETELLIQEALQRLTAGRTSIIIAHRLQTIQEADRVLVLDHGQVVELGRHDELLAADGLYATLHSLQFQTPTQNQHQTLCDHFMNQDPTRRPKSGEKFATEQGFGAIKNGIKNSTKATADIERKPRVAS